LLTIGVVLSPTVSARRSSILRCETLVFILHGQSARPSTNRQIDRDQEDCQFQSKRKGSVDVLDQSCTACRLAYGVS
jgi:hypothetical protein